MSESSYLIWSNEHGAWWRSNRRGYTTVIEWAGVYGEQEARQIMADSGLGEPFKAQDNCGLYADQVVPNEVLVPLTDEGHPGGADSRPEPGRVWMRDLWAAEHPEAESE